MSNLLNNCLIPVVVLTLAHTGHGQEPATTSIGNGVSLGAYSTATPREYEDPTDPELMKFREQLSESLKTWQRHREMNDGNYTYQHSQSSITGHVSVTTFEAKTGAVVRREHKVFVPEHATTIAGKPQQTGWQVRWVEQGKQLDTHPGVKPKTIEQLYAEADQLLRMKRSPTEKLSIEFDERGLLKFCFIIDNAIGCGGIRYGFPTLDLKFVR